MDLDLSKFAKTQLRMLNDMKRDSVSIEKYFQKLRTDSVNSDKIYDQDKDIKGVKQWLKD